MLACKICTSPSPRAIVCFQKLPWSLKMCFVCDFIDFCDSPSCLTSSQNISPEWKMSRPWTRSMPNQPEENYGTPQNHNFTQGQTSQQDSETTFTQVCRLYEQSQQQHQEMMNQFINMGSINHNPNYLSYKRRVLQHFLILTSLLRPNPGFETWREN